MRGFGWGGWGGRGRGFRRGLDGWDEEGGMGRVGWLNGWEINYKCEIMGW